MRVLSLMLDAFGGRGGIAAYNRALLGALCSDERVSELTVLIRYLDEAPGPLPPKLRFRPVKRGGAPAYVLSVLAELAANRRYDLILCGHINLLPLALVAKRICGAPVYLFVYGIEAWQPSGRLLRDRAVKHSDLIVSITRYTLDRLHEWAHIPPSTPSALIPPPIDLERFAPGSRNDELAAKLGLQGKKTIMSLCRLAAEERYKGVDQVLEALPALIEREGEVRYLICGDGSDRARLERKAADLGLSEMVIFAGWIPEEDKVEYLRLADVFAMPSTKEGFGIVFVEAAACGIPLVAHNSGGSPEALLGGELGILVDSGEADELAQALSAALNGQKPDRALLEGFSLPAFERKVQALLDGL